MRAILILALLTPPASAVEPETLRARAALALAFAAAAPPPATTATVKTEPPARCDGTTNCRKP